MLRLQSLYAFFLGFAILIATGCGKEKTDDEVPLDINLNEELQGEWKATYLFADLSVEVANWLRPNVKIFNILQSGGVTFDSVSMKAQFDIVTDMDIQILIGETELQRLSERDVEIDSRLSYEVINNNLMRFYVNDSIDDPIYLFEYIAFDDITFFPIEKSETELYLRANVDIISNFGDDVPELPSGDLPTRGLLYMRLVKVAQ
ncbi:MAG: hypothetical protein EA358_03830 [Flavobacteriales bacterium]|nr:MAG: hypothetical protein EA358_03830 [Flavobacteriales bacterium]